MSAVDVSQGVPALGYRINEEADFGRGSPGGVLFSLFLDDRLFARLWMTSILIHLQNLWIGSRSRDKRQRLQLGSMPFTIYEGLGLVITT